MPRATRLTPEVQETICKAIKTGMHLHRAAMMAGIPEGTYHRWMRQGDPDAQGEPDLQQLNAKQLRNVAAHAQVELPPRSTKEQMISILTEAGEGSWEPYRRFRQAVEKAELELEQTLVAQWRLQAPESNAALKEFMARRFKHWSPTHQVEVSGPEGQPIPIEVRAKAIAESAAAFRQTTKGES